MTRLRQLFPRNRIDQDAQLRNLHIPLQKLFLQLLDLSLVGLFLCKEVKFAGNHENVCLHARAIELSVELVALDA